MSGYEGRLTTRLGDVKAVEISATLFRCGDEEVLCGFVQDSGRVAHEADIPTLAESERRLILKALEKCKGRLSGPKGAAVLLGINRSTRWSRTQKLGITREMPAG